MEDEQREEKQRIIMQEHVKVLRKTLYEVFDPEKFKERYLDAFADSLAKGMIIGGIVGLLEFATLEVFWYNRYKSFHNEINKPEFQRIKQTTSQENPYFGVKYSPSLSRTIITNLEEDSKTTNNYNLMP